MNNAPMEEGFENPAENLPQPEKPKRDYVLAGGIVIAAVVLAGAWIYTTGLKYGRSVPPPAASAADSGALEEEVMPSGGVVLPAVWGDLGKRMAAAGVIDEAQFNALYLPRGGVPADVKAMLDGANNGRILITPQNSGMILNLLWAFGLANKNPILEGGPMRDPRYGGAGNFASTGGWTLAKGSAMSYYSKFPFVELTADAQARVEAVAKNIYRPCCGNSVYFPDCNHGMAMLGLLELMAAQSATEEQMYKAALAVNAYWFPDAYMTIAKYLEGKGIPWSAVNPKDILGENFSSAQGYAQVVAQTQPVQNKSSGGCGV